MKKRIKKKVWKEQTTAQQADLLERVAALEELTRCMTAEQTAQRERHEELAYDLHLYQNAHAKRHAVDDERRRRQIRARLEREQERRRKRQEWAKVGGVAAFAVAFMCFAVTFPAPDLAEKPIQTEVVAVEPAEGVVEAVTLIWED